jgi:hypothetical protein
VSGRSQAAPQSAEKVVVVVRGKELLFLMCGRVLESGVGDSPPFRVRPCWSPLKDDEDVLVCERASCLRCQKDVPFLPAVLLKESRGSDTPLWDVVAHCCLEQAQNLCNTDWALNEVSEIRLVIDLI